jgi:hypothetical protein
MLWILGIAVEISLLSCIQAEIHVFRFSGRHLAFSAWKQNGKMATTVFLISDVSIRWNLVCLPRLYLKFCFFDIPCTYKLMK